MSAPLPSSFPKPESEHTLPPGTQQVSFLHEEHGAPLLRQLYYPPEELLYAQWFGNLTSGSVIAGGQAALVVQQKLQPRLLLNDKSVATGDWTEAMDWLEFEWLPLALNYQLRAFAYVFSPDMLNQLSALEFFARVRRHIPIQLFYDADSARAWLLKQT